MTTPIESNKQRVLLVELNEFNSELMKKLAEEEGFGNILKLYNLNVIATKSDDTYESERLEPWVQWVSVHCGQNSLVHRIRHLGDVPDLQQKQLWERLSENKVSSGIWGVLNGSRGQSSNNKFFLPDPWTFSEKAYPEALNKLLDFPRYMATHRSDLSIVKVISLLVSFVSTLVLKPSAFKELPWILPRFFRMLFKYPKSEFVGYCPFEYFSGLLFLENLKKSQAQFGIVFLNMIAHVQHYYWDFSVPGNREKIVYALKFVDAFLEKVFADLQPEDKIYVMNALSQTNTNHEKPWVSYRPKSFEKLLEVLAIPFESVNSLMSYDAIVTFKSKEDCLLAQKTLEQVLINGQPLFYVELNEQSDKRLFFRSAFYDQTFTDLTFKSMGREFSFFEHFVGLAVRTAKHVPRGSLFTNNRKLSSVIYNHEIYNIICDDFGLQYQPGTKNIKEVRV
jgi:hypothetical protein